MKHVVNISFASTKNNFDSVVPFRGKTIRVSQFGADFDTKVFESLLRRFDGRCDVIGISAIMPPVVVGRRTYTHPDSQRCQAIPQQTPVVNGFTFRNTFVPWAVRAFAAKNPAIFSHQRIAFLSGLLQQHLASTLSEYSERLLFADPYLHLRVPKALRGMEALEKYAARMRPILQRITLERVGHDIDFNPKVKSPSFREFLNADLFVGTSTLLERFELSHLKGKTLILDVLPQALERELQRVGVKDVLFFTPELEATKREPRLVYSALEGLLLCSKPDPDRLTQDDILELITEYKLKPSLRSLSKGDVKKSRKFAFIIHPLSVKDFFRHPALRSLGKMSGSIEGILERGLTRMPGMAYGKISGIRSTSTGEPTEGLIYTLFDTPRQLLRADPECVYEKLVRVARHASDQGADIIGLGAFTKVVGDAGVTVASRSPIPVTTGNSLSAAATLWAARVACEKMGFLPPYKYGQRTQGTAMVVGANGSIGAVSAKLLGRVVSRLVLVGPRADRLLDLKEQIEAMNPETEVLVGTSPNTFSAQCDLIILSTSSLDGEVMDVDLVKPGAVICDVSRPLSISERQVLRRPDVLVIESGEVELPGKVEISCDIGLEDSVVYACLAETALLALEGRLEAFTLSRNISYERVREIYDMAKKHGARLATIRGPIGVITDQEIALCREHALKRLSEMSPPKKTKARKPKAEEALRV